MRKSTTTVSWKDFDSQFQIEMTRNDPQASKRLPIDRINLRFALESGTTGEEAALFYSFPRESA